MKKSFSIRAYLGFSHALLLIISLGAIGFIWSYNEYHVITQELQGLMRARVSLLSNIISHEIAEHGEVRIDNAEFPIINQEKNLLAVYIDNSGNQYELVSGTVSPRQFDLFSRLSDEYPVVTDTYATLIHSKFEAASVYAVAPVLDAQRHKMA